AGAVAAPPPRIGSPCRRFSRGSAARMRVWLGPGGAALVRGWRGSGGGRVDVHARCAGQQSGRGGRGGRRVFRSAENGHRSGGRVIADRRGDGFGVVTLGSNRLDHAPTTAERDARTRNRSQVAAVLRSSPARLSAGGGLPNLDVNAQSQ